MNNWSTVFLYEVTRQFQRKAFWLVTFGIPLIGALVLAGYLGYQEVRQRTGEPDQAEAEFSDQNPIGYVDETGYFVPPEAESPFAKLVMPYVTLEEGEAALRAETIDLLYILEADYFETGKVTVLLRDVSFDIFEHQLMDAFLINSLAREVDPQMVVRMRFPVVTMVGQKLAEDGSTAQEDNEDVNFFVVYLFALALMMTTFIASGYLMQSVVDEKESKVIEIILTSVKPFPLLLGKTLAMGVIGLAQIVVWAVAVFALLSIASANIADLSVLDVKPLAVVIAVIYYLLAYGVVGSVFAAMGALVSNTRDGSQLVGWVVLPFIVPLFFTTVFATNPDGTIARILSLVPFTSPLAMVMRVSVSSVPAWEVLVSILLTALLVVGCIWLAGRMFRVSSLLRGSPPKLRELPRLIWEG